VKPKQDLRESLGTRLRRILGLKQPLDSFTLRDKDGLRLQLTRYRDGSLNVYMRAKVSLTAKEFREIVRFIERSLIVVGEGK